MKKLCIVIFTAIILIMNCVVVLGEYDISIKYDVAPKVIITGSAGSDSGVTVTVLVHPYSDAEPSFAPDSTPLIADYFITGENGLFPNEIILPADIPAGVYTVWFSSAEQGKEHKNFIVFDRTSPAYITALERVNAANKDDMADVLSTQGVTLGIDTTELSPSDIAADAALLYAWRVIGGNYTAAAFSEACTAAEAIRLLKSGDSLPRILTNYPASFGASQAEYQALSDSQ
jgi:hypothetical protein